MYWYHIQGIYCNAHDIYAICTVCHIIYMPFIYVIYMYMILRGCKLACCCYWWSVLWRWCCEQDGVLSWELGGGDDTHRSARNNHSIDQPTTLSHQSDIQPTNEPTNQSNQSINQPDNQWINNFINISVNQPNHRTANQSTDQPINQLTNQRINQAAHQPIRRLVNQSIHRSIQLQLRNVQDKSDGSMDGWVDESMDRTRTEVLKNTKMKRTSLF